MGLIVPKHVQNEMSFSPSAALDFQKRLQTGCNCCSWPGDPDLVLQAIPSKHGNGWCVIQRLGENKPGCIVLRTDREFPENPWALDHRIITYLWEAHRAWREGADALIRRIEDAEAKEEAEMSRRGDEIIDGLVSDTLTRMKRGKSIVVPRGI